MPIFVNLATVAGHPELIKAGAVFCRFGQCLKFVAWMEGSSKSYVDLLMLEQPLSPTLAATAGRLEGAGEVE